jgi:hypothetical protein
LKKKTIIAAITAVVVLGAGLYLYARWQTVPALKTIPDLRNTVQMTNSDTYSKPAKSIDGMEGVTSNGVLSLYYNPETMMIAVQDQAGTVWHSNPEKLKDDTLANASVKDQLSSQILIDYSNNIGQKSSKNSSADSVSLKQAIAEPIEGGLKVTYTLGKTSSGIDILPKAMTAERYQTLILDPVGEKYERYLFVAYQNDKNKDVYERNDKELTALRLNKVIEAFEEAGYTPEDLMIDNAGSGADGDREVFTVPVEYKLQGDQLIARVPTSEVLYPKAFPLTNITLLPYFGAADTNDQGYMLVPDGSGSLIQLNNGKERYDAYIQPVYGDDGGTWNGEIDDDSTIEPIRLPVYGLKKNDSAFLAIIDQGAAVSSINAEVSKLKSSYNSVFPSFELISQERINLSAVTSDASTKSKEIPVFQQRPVHSDFSVRYAFLTEEAADYVGMATYYREYLQAEKVLTKQGVIPRNPLSGFSAANDL